MKQLKGIFSKVLVLAVALCICLTAIAGSAPINADAASGALKVPKDFIWGVNGHPDVPYCPVYKTRNMPQQIKLAAELGCKMYRINSHYKTMDDYEKLDAIVYEAAKYGMELMLVLEDCNPLIVKSLATRYNGKNGHGRIKYFQMHNETSGHFVTQWYEGHMREGYIMEKMNPYIKMFKDCAAALREAQPDCKIVINSASFSYFYFRILIENGVDFDVIGYDWYSRDHKCLPYAKNHENGLETFEDLLDYLCSFKKEVIICEINEFPMFDLANETQKETIDKVNTQNTFLPDVTKQVAAYANKNPLLKGMIIYELLDESFDSYPNDDPTRTDDINGEAHFGLVYTNGKGDILQPKPVYAVMQQLMGGGKVTTITPNFSLGGEDIIPSKPTTTTPSSPSSQVTSSETESTVSSEETDSSEITTTGPEEDKTDKKEDKKDKDDIQKEESPSFPLIPVIIGGAVALIAVLVGVFLLLKFKFGMFKK